MSDAPPLAVQAEAKAEAKHTADSFVAVVPHALHSVKLMFSAPSVKASTATGALIGAGAGGPPGAVVGGLIGFALERWQILGGPIGRIMRAIRGH